ncbi:MAG TPA: M20 family metallopeptidase [candidate division Zixibacteria bacterium]|nr:M20 family metallopeptidase [candidate division Zixibacteria bacterium]
MSAQATMLGNQILSFLQENRGEMISYLRNLVLAESPSTDPGSQAEIMGILSDSLRTLDYDVEMVPGDKSGGHLVARTASAKTNCSQLIIGHCDTVWPLGTVKRMPFIYRDGIAKGPGVFDMKGGLTQMVFALKAIRSIGQVPALEPILFINSDEEIGSFESEVHIRRFAQEVDRAFVVEPALGLSGKLKTARKGVGQFSIRIAGKAAHAGLDPGKGASAIRELALVIEALYAMADPARGVTVNVGIVEGGIRTNVVAPSSRARVDVRVPTVEQARQMESAIKELAPSLPGVKIEVSGGFRRLPMEATEDNQQLWKVAKSLGYAIGLDLDHGLAGGGSDGNTTSQYVATLDGLGPVGDGAHADHEFIFVDKLIERCGLLALLILAPEEGISTERS